MWNLSAYLGLINITFIVLSLVILLIVGEGIDLRKVTLSNYGIRPKTSRYFNFALVGFGMSHVIFFSVVAYKLHIISNSFLLFALLLTALCPVLTSIITLKRNFLIHTIFATSGIIFISLSAVLLSWATYANHNPLGLLGIGLPMIIIFGSLWGRKMNYNLGGMIEFFFIVALISWNLLFTVSLI